MIPLRDNIPSRTTPFVNYAVIGACTLVFLAQMSERGGRDSLVERYGMIPVRVLHPDRPVQIREAKQVGTPFGVVVRESTRRIANPSVPAWLTLLTCIFLHGGWMHFLGNMWFLYIFGDNVEDRFGHLGYLVFYLATGVAASGAHLATNLNSPVPTIGASGAIAGVMGAYFILYPRAKVMALIPIFIIMHMTVLPAWMFLGFWFVIQFIQGAFAPPGTQAVAWWAHIGGFVAGFAVAWVLRQGKKLNPAVDRVRPHTKHTSYYRVTRPHRRW